MIVIITISSIVVISALCGFWFYSFHCRRKRRGRLSFSVFTLLKHYYSSRLPQTFNLFCYSEQIPWQEFEGSPSINSMDMVMHVGDHDNGGEIHYFNLNTIQTATNNFSDSNKLGEGGFGPVYKVEKHLVLYLSIASNLLEHLHLKINYYITYTNGRRSLVSE